MKKRSIDSEIYLWARASEIENGLEELLFKVVKDWVKEKWPFKNIAFPGLEIEWGAWEKIT